MCCRQHLVCLSVADRLGMRLRETRKRSNVQIVRFGLFLCSLTFNSCSAGCHSRIDAEVGGGFSSALAWSNAPLSTSPAGHRRTRFRLPSCHPRFCCSVCYNQRILPWDRVPSTSRFWASSCGCSEMGDPCPCGVRSGLEIVFIQAG